jgi:hypothetical protein
VNEPTEKLIAQAREVPRFTPTLVSGSWVNDIANALAAAEARADEAEKERESLRLLFHDALKAAEAREQRLREAMQEVEKFSHIKSSTWPIARAALAADAEATP